MHYGFNKLKGMLAKSGAKDPGAVAASIGREKYGEKAMSKASHEAKPLKESQKKK